jgi:hypothetical protein
MTKKCLTCNSDYTPDQKNPYTSLGYCSTYCYGNSKYFKEAVELVDIIMNKLTPVERDRIFNIYNHVDFCNIFNSEIFKMKSSKSK